MKQLYDGFEEEQGKANEKGKQEKGEKEKGKGEEAKQDLDQGFRLVSLLEFGSCHEFPFPNFFWLFPSSFPIR